jgi:hypothetical protein
MEQDVELIKEFMNLKIKFSDYNVKFPPISS